MNTKFFGTLVAVLLMATAATVFAGGPLLVWDPASRTPWAYPPGNVPVYTDLGDNGILTGAVSDANTANGFAQWTAVGSSYFSASVAGDFSTVGLPDITGANAGLVVNNFNGGGIHVMYDDDGTITSNFFGAPPGVLGIASPDFGNGATGELTESWAMINGSAADPGDAAGTTYAGVFTHEFGHSINLAHTQTVGSVGFFGDGIGPDGCGTPYGGPLTLDDFETMYPYLDITPGSTGQYQATVDHADDIAALSSIYPTAGFPGTHGTITGIVYGPDGMTELTGINVIARPVSDPFKGAVSALSGDYTQGALGPDGLFTLNGLTPGEDYVLYIDEIVAGGFSTSPISIPGDGSEEYWNNAEAVDPNIDDPCDYTLITAAAGSPFTADILVNGNPNDLDLGDDDYELVSLPFPFPFCGQSYTSVYVGSNGFVTFGSPDTDFSESVGEFLTGPARIAPLWDDFNPSDGGSITALPDGPDFLISWNNVPEWGAATTNSFELRLRADGTFDVTYSSIAATDGLAGRTTGGGEPDPGETDLSTAAQPIGALMTTVYEYFGSGDNDLDGGFLAFAPCVVPDPAEIEVDPTSLTATLRPGESTTQVLDIKNLGQVDLEWAIASSQGSGSPASGGVIPRFDGGSGDEEVVLNEAQIAKLNVDLAAGSGTKPEINPLKVYLPHAYALSLVNEDFNGGFPAGWSAIDNEGGGVNWLVPAQGGGNYTGGTGDACGASSDDVGAVEFDCELRTPAISGFGPNVVLSFKANYQNFGFLDYFDVDVSTDGGGSWTNVLRWNEDHGGFFGSPGEQVSLNLDPVVAGAADFMVRFRYYDPNSGDYDWYVQIDDVMIVSDEAFTPCGYITAIAPDAGTTPGGGTTPVDVTFDATGYAPGTYDCELIVNSNAVNEPRLAVPLTMIVAHDAALDIKPGSCPNPFNLHLFEFLDDAKPRKGGILPVALAGKEDFDVAEVDLSTIRLEGVAPLAQGGGPQYEDVATAHDNDGCNCIGTRGDGIMDINMKFQSQEIAAVISPGIHGSTLELRMTGYLNDGTMFIAEDCIRFVSNISAPPPAPLADYLGAATPNPFNPTTRINFSVANTGPVNLSVFDVKGRLVERLVNGTRTAGEYSVTWEASGLPSGIYFYRLETPTFNETRKLVLLK
jgi:hypothetical protein